MEQKLTVTASRISSFKSLFFPMKYELFLDESGNISINSITRNIIGQKTIHRESSQIINIKGFILRRMIFASAGTPYAYGRFWAKDCRKVKKFIQTHQGEGKQILMSDTWF